MQLKGVLAVLGSLSVIAIIILCVTISSNEHNWCTEDHISGDCELYDQDNTCYCIDKISLTHSQTDYYGASQASCEKLGGHLATARNGQLLKWLAKRLYLMVDSMWYWMEPEGPLEANELLWRQNVEQNQHLTHASIDVRSIVIRNNEYDYGYKSYNYDFYIDYDTNYRWYGFVRMNITTNEEGDRFCICHYDTKPNGKQENVGMHEEEMQVLTDTKNPTTSEAPLPLAITAKEDPCQCSQYEPVDLSELGESKIIGSPGYPTGYCMNQKCGWSVTAPGDLAIRLQWMAFNTEDQMDFVFVYDAQYKDNTKLLAACTGTACTNHISSGQSLYVNFISDHVTQDIGFRGVVTAVNTDSCYCSDSEHITLLGSTEQMESYFFTSPNFPNDNCKNQNCKWIISGPDHYGLHISWNQFSVGPSSIVALHDGNLHGKNCSDEQCDDLITETSQLTVQFTSESRNGSNVGFSALVNVVKNYCDKRELNAIDSIVYTRERENGLVAIGGTATFTCPGSHIIIDTLEDVTDTVVCISPHWSRQLESQCIAVCDVDFVMVTKSSVVMHMCDFGSIQQTTLVPSGHTIMVETYKRTDKQHVSSLEYHCTNVGWSPEPPVCAKMTEAILLIGGKTMWYLLHNNNEYRNIEFITALSLYIPQKTSSTLNLELPNGREGHSSELMTNGKVIVMGGSFVMSEYVSSGYIVDVNLGKVETAQDMNSVRNEPTSCRLNQVVYFCSGYTTEVPHYASTNCDAFDGYSWSLTADNMITSHYEGDMVALNGSLYIMGGDMGGGTAENMVERYSQDTNEWQQVEPMQERRRRFAAAVLNGIIYVCGGAMISVTAETVSSCEQFVDCASEECDNDQNKIWKTIAHMNVARHDFALEAFGGKLYALGGMKTVVEIYPDSPTIFKDDEVLKSVESYDPITNEWVIEELELPLGMEGHTAVLLNVLEGVEQLH